MPQSEFWPFPRNKTADNLNEEASLLQKQLGDMEGEVKEIQMELAAIKKDRLDLFQRNQSKGYGADLNEIVREADVSAKDKLQIQEDEYHRYPEVLKLREELIRAKNAAEEERFQRQKYEMKLKDLELKLNSICCPGILHDVKDQRKTNDTEVGNLKKQIRELKDEMEEINLTVTEKTEQLQEYRVKYLQAQQQVEELRRQQEVIDFDNKQVSDQIQIEIQKMKMQFQEKLQELAPLPDLLKGAQIQLQEAKQLQRLADENSQQLSNELIRIKEKLVIAVTAATQEKAEKSKAVEENKTLRAKLEEKSNELDEISRLVDDYKCQVLRVEEKLSQQEGRYNEKAEECAALLKTVEEQRQENGRTLARAKERADSMRRYLQTQVSELERQLVQSRAQCRQCQKERDEIRQRMQIQINNLQENFELVEIRLRGLQSQVASLKNSYTVILADEEDCEMNKIATAAYATM